jgi:FAD:protein FMN transferase
MNSAAVQGRTDGGIHRRVEHIIGMPISLALRGRHTATAEGHDAWQEVINQLRGVDQIFSTYRDDPSSTVWIGANS